jgi:hypothetical protein
MFRDQGDTIRRAIQAIRTMPPPTGDGATYRLAGAVGVRRPSTSDLFGADPEHSLSCSCFHLLRRGVSLDQAGLFFLPSFRSHHRTFCFMNWAGNGLNINTPPVAAPGSASAATTLYISDRIGRYSDTGDLPPASSSASLRPAGVITAATMAASVVFWYSSLPSFPVKWACSSCLDESLGALCPAPHPGHDLSDQAALYHRSPASKVVNRVKFETGRYVGVKGVFGRNVGNVGRIIPAAGSG